MMILKVFGHMSISVIKVNIIKLLVLSSMDKANQLKLNYL